MEFYHELQAAVKPFSDFLYEPNVALSKLVGLDVEGVTYLIAMIF